jgi:hypothetical protein
VVLAFDTLYLRERGISQEHAEAHAEATRQFIMAELVTKADLAPVRADLAAVRQDLTNTVAHFDAKLENLSLRLTVRLGIMLAAGIGALAALVKLT